MQACCQSDFTESQLSTEQSSDPSSLPWNPRKVSEDLGYIYKHSPFWATSLGVFLSLFLTVCVRVYVSVSLCEGGYTQVYRGQKRLIVRSLGAGAIGPCELQDADSGNWAPVLYKSRNALNHWVICHSSSKLESQTEVSSWLSLTMKTYTKCQSFQSSDSSLWLANRALAGWLHVPLHSFAETQACKDGQYCMYLLLCGDAQACECMWSPKYNCGCLLQPLLLVPETWLSLSLELTHFTRLASQWVPKDPWVSTH